MIVSSQCVDFCNNKISRGGEGKKAGTYAMTNHLRNKHHEEYSTVSAVPSTSEETALGTPMRSSLKTQLEQRFDFKENDKYLVATFLDPRYKTSFLGLAQADRARQTILLQALKMSCDFEYGNGSTNDIDINNDYSPPAKKTNYESGSDSEKIHNSFWDCFDEVAKVSDQSIDIGKNSAANEIDYFLQTVRLDRKEDPFKW
ncbi:hypothetical protein J6590_101175 [Homalodisca vitripennis]|nr:hypothetical protein J6590_101175 [Homalodisca vitripennis]